LWFLSPFCLSHFLCACSYLHPFTDFFLFCCRRNVDSHSWAEDEILGES
jgi:hypothetical protein